MKIAFFTTGYYPVNKKNLKAIELLTYQMAEEFAKRGHEVHVFGSSESEGNFKVHQLKVDNDLRLKAENEAYYYLNLAKDFCDTVDYCSQNKFDVIIDQTNSLSYTLARYSRVPVVSIMHGPRVISELSSYHQASHLVHIIAPSQYVRDVSPDLRIEKIIPHGVDQEKFIFNDNPENYFLSLGRIIPDKGQLDAIEAAKLSNVKLVIGGYHPDYLKDDSYFRKVLSQIELSQQIKFVGKVERAEVPTLVANAKAFLMPIKWPEPFGLVMIESLVCGTPVIAYNLGSVPEIIEEGVTGFIVPPDDTEAFSEAINKINNMSSSAYQKMRKACRKRVEEKFSLKVMVNCYEKYITELSNQ